MLQRTDPTSVTLDEALRFDTLTLPALPTMGSATRPRTTRARWSDDRWLVAMLLCASVASVATLWWAISSHTILLYGDAHSHLLIGRRVLDGLAPGLAQLGNVWLPLPHLIMLPFIWNDTLWRTGLAGSLASMPCYLIASVYVFLTARRLTHDSRASFIGSLVFILNPNILYLQVTPLSEPVLFATLAAASYYFIAWAQDDQLNHLALAAFTTFLATLARYDGWALYLALQAMLLIICWRKGFPRDKTIAYSLVFGSLGGAGILLWLLWNLVIFGSPVAFLSGSFSSQEQTQSFIHAGLAETYHNLWQSIRTYAIAAAESIGPSLFLLGVVAVLIYTYRQRLSADALAALTLLVPFAFYIAAFYLGQDVMYVPYANHPPSYIFYNARFGAEMAAPAAIFIATLIATARRSFPLAQYVLILAIIGQSAITSWGGAIALQDGQAGLSCNISHPIVAFLAQHYDGGRILIDEYHSQIDLSSAKIPFQNEIYEGDGAAWNAALAHPATYVNWLIIVPHDLVSQHIDTHSVAFQSQFLLVAQDSPTGARLYRRESSPPLPSHPLPNDVVAPYTACNHSKGIPIAQRAPSLIAALAPPAPAPTVPAFSLTLTPARPSRAQAEIHS